MSSTSARSITHTGTSSNHLTIQSTAGKTLIESVTFDGSSISTAGNLKFTSSSNVIQIDTPTTRADLTSTPSNSDCGGSFSIGHRKAGKLRLPYLYNDGINRNCPYYGNQVRQWTVSHSYGRTDYLVFLTTQVHPAVGGDNNFFTLGVKSISSTNFVFWIGNPTGNGHTPGSGNRYEIGYFVITGT